MITRQATARLVRRHRRPLAAAAAGMSVLFLGASLRPEPLPTQTVVVAAKDLPTGHRLDTEDVTTSIAPAGILPPGTSGVPEEVIGRVLAAPLARGEAITATRLMTPPGWAVPPGTVPLPVRFADAASTRLLSAGQRVDVLGARQGEQLPEGIAGDARLIAVDAMVLAVTGSSGSAGGWLEGTEAGATWIGAEAPLVVLAVTRTEALAIAGSQSGGSLSFALRGRSP